MTPQAGIGYVYHATGVSTVANVSPLLFYEIRTTAEYRYDC
ncbi:MAG: hypothetical protein WB711_23090 [Terriglobales bacterium]